MYRLTILAACIAMPLVAQTTIQPSASTSTTETKTFALQSGNKLSVSNPNGNITISTWDKDEVALTADFKPSSNDKQALIIARNLKNKLKLTVKYPRKKIWKLTKKETKIASCEIELTVPHRVVSSISSINGSVVLNATDGQNKVETKNGAIVLNEITGQNKLKTKNGNISLNGINGNADIFTPSGNITGSVQNIESLKVFTHTGNISVKLLNLNCSIVASAAPGEVTLQPTGAKNFEYEKGKTIRATFGDGSASVNIRTLAGSIVIE